MFELLQSLVQLFLKAIESYVGPVQVDVGSLAVICLVVYAALHYLKAFLRDIPPETIGRLVLGAVVIISLVLQMSERRAREHEVRALLVKEQAGSSILKELIEYSRKKQEDRKVCLEQRPERRRTVSYGWFFTSEHTTTETMPSRYCDDLAQEIRMIEQRIALLLDRQDALKEINQQERKLLH